MLVSMTPNDEVKTIHASLNDGSLRKWEFEPYTEQGKIELTDQNYATIQSIKGNTVKFNQLVENGNFESRSGWIYNENPTFTVSNNIATVKGNTDFSGIYRRINLLQNHKYYLSETLKAEVDNYNFLSGVDYLTSNNAKTLTTNFQTFKRIGTYTGSNVTQSLYFYDYNNATRNNVYIKNVMLFDLTLIFGLGSEPATPEAFETWLSNNIGLLPYYDYTQGTLIPFNGTGLKTTGKNLWNEDYSSISDVIIYKPVHVGNGTFTLSTTTPKDNGSANLFFLSGIVTSGASTSQNGVWNGQIRTINSQDGYVTIGYRVVNLEQYSPVNYNTQLEYGSTSTSYEPYTESTLSLPISTYFPTGMKEVGSVYDELSDKAYTRTKQFQITSSNIISDYLDTTNNQWLGHVVVSDIKQVTDSNIKGNIVCNILENKNQSQLFAETGNAIALLANNTNVRITLNGITTFADMQTWLDNNPTYFIYELATPTSQDISLDLTYPIWNDGTEQILPVNSSTPTTSPMVATIEYPDRTEDVNFLYKQTTFESAIPQFSLVCKNQELPMALEDGKLICECDSSITNESGFFDAKVKMQDLNSVAYSQKIQLHVERGIND